MQTMKHFAETVSLETKGRLDKTTGLASVRYMRNEMRRFYNACEQETCEVIPSEVKEALS